jgi:predicted nucleic acid-binding protein
VRLVLDTNTAISGLLWSGPPSQVIDVAIVGMVVFSPASSFSMSCVTCSSAPNWRGGSHW